MSVESRYETSGISHEIPSESERLDALSRFLDPVTFETLEQVNIRPDWACLDVGAGNGSVAEWLARKVPVGSVLATDLDIRYLREDVERMTPLVHDVVRNDFAPASFDLVHVRMLLMHLPRPEEVVRKLVRWLKPGGYLVIGGFDVSVGAASPHPPMARVADGMQRMLREDIGTDLRTERLAPQWMRRNDLIDVHVAYHPAVAGSGHPGQAFLRASLEQLQPAIVGKGLCQTSDFEAFYKWLDDPDSVDVYGVVPMIRGRKPGGGPLAGSHHSDAVAAVRRRQGGVKGCW
ncbi:class I SAM-dependent methyltransferase [Amycolatopsis sp. NPDC004368]